MKSMSLFQIVVIGIFVALVVVGIGVFSLFGGVGGKSATGRVTLWGPLDQNTMQKVISTLAEKDKSYEDIIYTAYDPATYQAQLINAIASGQGPDLFFVSQESMGTLADKAVLIPYASVPQATYLSSYIDEAQLFLAPQGVLAMPFSIDPLVMYWNRDLFTSAGVAQPPQTWDDFIALAPRLSSLDGTQGVRRSAVALGTWDNTNNAKAILSALFMQSGDFITGRSQTTGSLVPLLGGESGSTPPAAEALRFYTDFANPSKAVYSWNRSLPNSLQSFLSGDLAIYFGFASEYQTIAARNPNLHFSVALMPQLKNSAIHITYGNIAGVALARSATNPQGALLAAIKLSTPDVSAALLGAAGLPPVRRDTLPDTSTSAALAAVVQSALISRGWADPSQRATDALFKEMIDSVIAGRSDPSQAVFDAAQGLRQLLPNQ